MASHVYNFIKNLKESKGIPKYFWALLLFFAYDDLLPLMSMWFIYYPICIFVALAILCISVGLFFILGEGQ